MDQIESLLKRPRAYYNVDGMGELGGGVMLLAYGLIQWVIVQAPRDSVWHKSVWLIFIVAMAAIHYGTKAIKERITYPRTGYVEYSETARRLSSVIAAVIAAIFALGLFVVVRSHRDMSLPCSFIGLPIAAAYARGFARTATWKWAVFAVLAIGSVTIGILPADLMGALARNSGAPGFVSAKATGACMLTFLLFGAVFLISGGISLRLYLRRTQSLARDVA